MSTTSTISAPVEPVAATNPLRRWALLAAPVLAGLFAILGAAADPAVGQSGVELWTKYAANPEPLQFKSFGFHWSYAFWLLPPLLIAGLVRRRGRWLANTGAVLGFVGISTLPGLLVVDFYDSAIGQVAGVETTQQVNQMMETMWAIQAITLPGMIGFLLALPVAVAAAWRAGLVRWWAFAAVAAGQAAFMLSGVTTWGCAITTACFAVLSYALSRVR